MSCRSTRSLPRRSMRRNNNLRLAISIQTEQVCKRTVGTASIQLPPAPQQCEQQRTYQRLVNLVAITTQLTRTRPDPTRHHHLVADHVQNTVKMRGTYDLNEATHQHPISRTGEWTCSIAASAASWHRTDNQCGNGITSEIQGHMLGCSHSMDRLRYYLFKIDLFILVSIKLLCMRAHNMNPLRS